MDSVDKVFVLGPCYVCGVTFTFNAETVPSLHIDPQTNRPPDVDAAGKTVKPDPASVERAIRQPICPTCVSDIETRAGERKWHRY